MTRIEQWLMAWAHIFDGLACVLTFTLWRPSFAIRVTLWSLWRRCERIADGEEIVGCGEDKEADTPQR